MKKCEVVWYSVLSYMNLKKWTDISLVHECITWFVPVLNCIPVWSLHF